MGGGTLRQTGKFPGVKTPDAGRHAIPHYETRIARGGVSCNLFQHSQQKRLVRKIGKVFNKVWQAVGRKKPELFCGEILC